MSTYRFKNYSASYTMLNNVFIDNYMAKARGEFIKVYILGLRFMSSGELGISSEIIASNLNLLETDVLNAWNYWSEEGIINFKKIDNMGNYDIEFLELTPEAEGKSNVNILEELSDNKVKDLLKSIEKLLGRILSPKEVSLYLSFMKDFDFSPEVIVLLVEYSISKGKNDSRYIEKIAMAWHDNNIKTLEDAQSYIKFHEDKWINIRKVLTYLGISGNEVMKPQEEMITKWLITYKFPLDVIYKACDICFQRINKAEFKYIDSILKNWFESGIKSSEDVDIKNTNSFKKDKRSPYGDYKQKEYDIKDIEKKLLGWDKDD
jgi:DnaD/phage-associated family protein